MNLIDYARILVHRGWIMLLLAVLAAGSAYFLSTQQTPIYRSTQKVLIQPSRNDFGLTEASRILLNSYEEYLYSELRAATVIDQLRLDMTPSDLLSNVTIQANRDRLTIQIDVDSTDPNQANDIARAWGNELERYRNDQNQQVRREDQIEASLQDNARATLNRPRPTINAVAGGVLGLLLGGMIVFVLEYLESSVLRRREDVERSLALQVLAAIPDFEG
jgi:capsular polysaccharide biosynthesis protein